MWPVLVEFRAVNSECSWWKEKTDRRRRIMVKPKSAHNDVGQPHNRVNYNYNINFRACETQAVSDNTHFDSSVCYVGLLSNEYNLNTVLSLQDLEGHSVGCSSVSIWVNMLHGRKWVQWHANLVWNEVRSVGFKQQLVERHIFHEIPYGSRPRIALCHQWCDTNIRMWKLVQPVLTFLPVSGEAVPVNTIIMRQQLPASHTQTGNLLLVPLSLPLLQQHYHVPPLLLMLLRI